MILDIVYNQIFQAALMATLSAQLLKTVFDGKSFELGALFSGAGMPSSHTATVVALALSVYLSEGLTTLFIITLVLSVIVVRDVLGDKIFARQQEEKINQFLKEFVKGEAIHWKHLIGHTISEVSAGVAVGIAVTLFVFFFDLDFVSSAIYIYISELLQ